MPFILDGEFDDQVLGEPIANLDRRMVKKKKHPMLRYWYSGPILYLRKLHGRIGRSLSGSTITSILEDKDAF